MKKIKKQSFTLLEVLIAFLLVLIALVPLFAPYPYMFKREQAILFELEMDRYASLFYVELLADLLKNGTDKDSLKGEARPISAKMNIPYTAAYIFSEDEVSIVFTPIKEGEPFAFNYVL